MIGNLPLSLSSSLSQLRIRQISLYGVGLLVGASLTIIIPEGVDAVYESGGYDAGEGKTGGHGHEAKSSLVGLALILGFLLMYVVGRLDRPKRCLTQRALRFLIDQLQASHQNHGHVRSSARSWTSGMLGSGRRHASVSSARPLLTHPTFSVAKRTSASNLRAAAASPSPNPANGQTAMIGGNPKADVSMSIDDEEAGEHTYGGIGGNRGYRPHDDDDHDSQAEDYFPTTPLHNRMRPSSPYHRSRSSISEKQTQQGMGSSWSTSIGLIAHSFADGVSLGASSATITTATSSLLSAAAVTAAEEDATAAGGSRSLDLVVFLAIMVHKAPAAFGLVAVLMSAGLSRSKIRQVLLAFSAAAPLGALATWGLLQLLMRGGGDDEAKQVEKVAWWTGMALLFSGGGTSPCDFSWLPLTILDFAGTFLFVATHVMQDSEGHGDASSQGSPGTSESSVTSGRGGPEHINLTSPGPSAAAEAKDRGLRSGGPAGDEGEVGRWTKTFLMVGGMVSPMILTKIVGHGH